MAMQSPSPTGQPIQAMNYSQEQQAIFQHFEREKENLIVMARAGTGKTTTIKAAFEHAPEGRMLYAVFNKKLQKEAEAKITDHRVDVKTLHSLGYMFIKRVWSNAKPDGEVESDRACVALGPIATPERVGIVCKLVGFAKNTCIEASREDLQNICESQDIQFDMGVNGIGAALRVLELSKVKDKAGRISFNDMVWLPCAMNLVTPRYDMVVIDEAQDMNLPQLTMAMKASKGRVVAVGDDRQAIYGFRGAVQNGMQMMKLRLRAKTLSLTTTYRCPKLVVDLAKSVVLDYQWAQEAPDGEIQNVNEAKALALAQPGDAILSRLNAPLMPMALSLLRRNIPARIEGRDIGKQLIGMVKSMKAKTVEQFCERVEEWRAKQIERLSKAKNADKKVEQVSDIAQTLLALAENATDVYGIELCIKKLFQDTDEHSKPAIILSSVHKAKGLEWDRVFMLSWTFRKGKGYEEDNIWYVAVTRSKRALFIVGQGDLASVEEKPAIKPVAGVERPVSKPSKGPPPRPGTAVPVLTQAEIKERQRQDAAKLDAFSLPAGMVNHRTGNVIKHGGAEYVCTRVSKCNAEFTCLVRKVSVITSKLKTNEDGSPVTGKITHALSKMAISIATEPSEIIRRMSESELEQFLARGTARRGEEKQTQGEKGNENIMSKKVKKAKGAKVMDSIVKLAKSGKTEKDIHAAVKAEHGPVSAHLNYVIGREWRRVNKTAKPAKVSKVKVAKPTAKAKGSKKAPPARKMTPSRPPPRPAAAAPVAPVTPAPAAPAAPAEAPVA